MNWWRQRSAREKLGLVAACALLSVVALFLTLEPLVQERRRLSDELPGLREDLAWMQAQLGEARRLREPVTDADRAELSPERIEALLEVAGLRRQVSAMQPQAGQGLLISFDDVNFADLLALISRLQDEGLARVTDTRVNGLGDQSGRVMAELKLFPR